MSSKFSRKAVQLNTNTGGSQATVDPDAWSNWHKHRHERCPFLGKKSGTKDIKEGVGIAVVNFIFDMGYPSVNAKDGKSLQYWDTKVAVPKGDEEYSQAELDNMAKFPDSDYVWYKEWDNDAGKQVEKRKQTTPYRARQEYGVCVDIPTWTVDHSLHPYATSTEPDFRPVRISLNGEWDKKIQRDIAFGLEWDKKAGKEVLKDSSLIYKIAINSGLEEELLASGGDIGTMVQATCNLKIKSVLNTKPKDDGTEAVFLNIGASSPTMIQPQSFRGETITVEEQIEEALKDSNMSDFTGILLDMDEYEDSMFEMLGEADHFHFVQRAETSESWELSGTGANGDWSFEKGIQYSETPFAKAHAAWLTSKGSSNMPEKAPETVIKEESKQTPAEVEKPAEVAPEMDFDEDIPF